MRTRMMIAASAAVCSALAAQTPPPPTSLCAVAVSSVSVHLTWSYSYSGSISGFKINRKTGLLGDWQELATVGAGARSWYDTGCQAHTIHHYTVYAIAFPSSSDLSNMADATTDYPSVPAAPDGLIATAVSTDRIELAWRDNSSNETWFQIERKTGLTGSWSGLATLNWNTTSFSDTGLSTSTSYFYRVCARDGTMYSALSDQAGATTWLDAPANVCISHDAGRIQITWDPVPEAASYIVRGADSPGGPFSDDQSGVFNGTSWTVPVIHPARFFQVVASADPPGLVLVQGGTIYPEDGLHTDGITVGSFYMGKHEVTNAEWNAVMGGGAVDNYPKRSVSWLRAIEYCNRRSMKEGLSPCYFYNDGVEYGTDPDDWPTGWDADAGNGAYMEWNWTCDGYRLPSDLEWEYAARGGMRTHGHTYSGGMDLATVGWYEANSKGSPHPVGQLASNELGIHDMSGNLWEWTFDQLPAMQRVVRGGCYNGADYTCAVAWQSSGLASGSYAVTGFRVCRKLQR